MAEVKYTGIFSLYLHNNLLTITLYPQYAYMGDIDQPGSYINGDVFVSEDGLYVSIVREDAADVWYTGRRILVDELRNISGFMGADELIETKVTWFTRRKIQTYPPRTRYVVNTSRYVKQNQAYYNHIVTVKS